MRSAHRHVSVLFNEPKLLKCGIGSRPAALPTSFSALQRAEIAEIGSAGSRNMSTSRRFSALQRAEIAEIAICLRYGRSLSSQVSVLFNEPKLLKFYVLVWLTLAALGFSALQRAEIAEIRHAGRRYGPALPFQCSSTSRNC